MKIGIAKHSISRRILNVAVQFTSIVCLVACAVAPPQEVKVQDIPVFPPAPDQARFYFERTLYTSADVEKEDKDVERKVSPVDCERNDSRGG